MLRPDGVFLIDYESEAFIWIGKDVPKDVISDAYMMALDCLSNVNSKSRMKVMSLNLICYAFEPTIFKSAFSYGWINFSKPGIDDFEIREDSEESGTEEKE